MAVELAKIDSTILCWQPVETMVKLGVMSSWWLILIVLVLFQDSIHLPIYRTTKSGLIPEHQAPSVSICVYWLMLLLV